MFIIPAIQQSAMGADDDSLLGTMHLNALNGSGDVLGSSSLSNNCSLGGCFRGPPMLGTTSSPTTSSPSLATPSYSGRGQRRGEVFGGLFGACVSDNHPYRPHDSGTAFLFQEDPSKTATAAAVVNAGLATAGTSQLFVPPDGMTSPGDSSTALGKYSEDGAVDKTAARKTGDKSSRHKKPGLKLHHQMRVDSISSSLAHNTSHYEDVCYNNKIASPASRQEGQHYSSDEISSLPSSLLADSPYEANLGDRLRESQLLFQAKESDRKRRGKGKQPRRHSLDLDLALGSPLSVRSSSKKDGRTKSASRGGRNSIPSDLELALHSARPGCRHHRGDLDTEFDTEDLTLSISEVGSGHTEKETEKQMNNA
ncbi:hypothetical protein ElyMa_006706000 [Elysia marginata]|uniref:Pecanex-like protein n=1 Tax=Elysia marginata TaxID=1093978 RepID=A0AAV4ITP7_9GAST|nr:hypothetical protein ElyMa_006706000 [Elysia marginata]